MAGPDRRTVLITAAATVLAGSARATPAHPGPRPVLGDDVALGNPKAPVTVIEYASAGCPHCAEWSLANFAAFRKRYIDSGQVRFVLREMLTGEPSIAIAGFLIARRAAAKGGVERYFQVLHDTYAAQPRLFAGSPTDTPLTILGRIARDAGLTQAETDACLADPAAIRDVERRNDRWGVEFGVDSTPTFVIGDLPVRDGEDPAKLAAAIAKARKHAGKG
jgi:protein-disulfide isomerase